VHAAGPLLLTLALLILATRLLGEAAQRVGQPAVIGELLAGILLGPSLLGFIAPTHPTLEAFAQLGVLILLFEIGLHTDLRSLREAGKYSLIVAVVGVVVPFVAGYFGTRWLGFSSMEALVAGAALTATSIGISARTLRDIGRLDSIEGQVVLGAAVLDDLIGLIILSVVVAMAAGDGFTAMSAGKSTVIALGFVAIAIGVGSLAMPPVIRFAERLSATGALGLVALAFAFLLATLAESAGSAMIVGALAAGLVLHRTPQRAAIERSVTQLGYFFVPIFFAMIGALVDLRSLADPRALLAGAVLVVIAVAGKVVAGLALRGFEGNRLLVGVAMVPRGEVGLIFAQVGIATGAIAGGQFGAIMLMVVVTTLVTPPWLAAITRTKAVRSFDPAGEGLDDLVSGARPHTPRATQPVKRNYNG
jgi:Kef-type K+ transport system membrane component KefB